MTKSTYWDYACHYFSPEVCKASAEALLSFAKHRQDKSEHAGENNIPPQQRFTHTGGEGQGLSLDVNIAGSVSKYYSVCAWEKVCLLVNFNLQRDNPPPLAMIKQNSISSEDYLGGGKSRSFEEYFF